MTNPIKIALLGAGIYMNEMHCPALQALSDQFEVVAVYSRTLQNAQSLAAKFGTNVEATTDLTAVLARNDIQAVDIALPITVQPAIIRQAFAARKHVISEKPVAPDIAAAKSLIDIYRHYSDLVWMVGENWRYEDAFQQAAALVQQGEIGDVLSASWTIMGSVRPANKYYQTAWRQTPDYQGGFILDGGVHRTAAIRLIVGEVVAINALAKQFRADLPPADTVVANMVFASGAIGGFLHTFGAEVWVEQPLIVAGTRGTLQVTTRSLEIQLDSEKKTFEVDRTITSVQRELAAFAESVQHGTPHHNSPEEALRDVAMIQAMMESATKGTTVYLDVEDV